MAKEIEETKEIKKSFHIEYMIDDVAYGCDELAKSLEDAKTIVKARLKVQGHTFKFV